MKDKTIDCLKLCSMPYGGVRDKFQKKSVQSIQLRLFVQNLKN